ncbi:MAG: pantoate--beta-alanine ligase [Bacteroidales bacterium]|jgi:pantoate--beta-alanine ligase|nr:pantoate--beta-alanine ligase [Bacteroidales bacterium]
MLIIKSVEELMNVAFRVKSNGKSVGLVPTMGALHAGHVSLLQKARQENEVVVCSIFVNPVQFNHTEDFEKYPRVLEHDMSLIADIADILFIPSEKEIYPTPPTEQYHFGFLETVMEGAARPGHFNGVATIVKRLLDWITPDKAYFGEKDYQQLLIIRQLVKDYKLNVQIVPCPIVREANGLAMSSRNTRLSPEALNKAGLIHRVLSLSTQAIHYPVEQIKQLVIKELNDVPEFEVEYFEIADATTLQPVTDMNTPESVMGFIALHVEGVRLIDNIKYK